jgi:hypothetical protein
MLSKCKTVFRPIVCFCCHKAHFILPYLLHLNVVNDFQPSCLLNNLPFPPFVLLTHIINYIYCTSNIEWIKIW